MKFGNQQKPRDPSLAHTHTSTLARLTTAVNNNTHITSHIKLLECSVKRKHNLITRGRSPKTDCTCRCAAA